MTSETGTAIAQYPVEHTNNAQSNVRASTRIKRSLFAAQIRTQSEILMKRTPVSVNHLRIVKP